MKISKKRCFCCHRWFQTHPRTAAFQRFCPRPKCRRQSRLKSHHAWWRANGPATNAARAPKVRAWAACKGYWRHYRASHPDYVRRDNQRRTSALKLARRSAKQDTIRRIAVGKLNDILALAPEMSAKQDTIHRRVDGIMDYLLWKEGSAKQDSMSPAGAAVVNSPA